MYDYNITMYKRDWFYKTLSSFLPINRNTIQMYSYHNLLCFILAVQVGPRSSLNYDISLHCLY